MRAFRWQIKEQMSGDDLDLMLDGKAIKLFDVGQCQSFPQDELLEAISKCGGIEELRSSDSRCYSDRVPDILEAILANDSIVNSLRVVDLGDIANTSNYPERAERNLDAITQLIKLSPNIHTAVLQKCYLDENDMIKVCDEGFAKSKSSNIQKIGLGKMQSLPPFDGSFVSRFVSYLKLNASLCHVDLGGCKALSAEALDMILNSLQVQASLSYLRVGGIDWSRHAGAEDLIISFVKNCKTLVHLDLGDDYFFSPKSLDEIVIHCSARSLVARGLPSSASCFENSKLEEWELTINNWDWTSGDGKLRSRTQGCTEALMKASSLWGVKSLEFERAGGTSFSNQLKKDLCITLKTNLTLRYLSLNQCSSEVTLQAAELLKSSCPLEELVLDYCILDVQSLGAIFEALKTNTHLTSLNLDHSGGEDCVPEPLCDMLKVNSTLTSLHVPQYGNSNAPQKALNSIANAMIAGNVFKVNSTLRSFMFSFIRRIRLDFSRFIDCLEGNTTIVDLGELSEWVEPTDPVYEILSRNRTLFRQDARMSLLWFAKQRNLDESQLIHIILEMSSQ
jgi:hypothetical protein